MNLTKLKQRDYKMLKIKMIIVELLPFIEVMYAIIYMIINRGDNK